MSNGRTTRKPTQNGDSLERQTSLADPDGDTVDEPMLRNRLHLTDTPRRLTVSSHHGGRVEISRLIYHLMSGFLDCLIG